MIPDFWGFRSVNRTATPENAALENASPVTIIFPTETIILCTQDILVGAAFEHIIDRAAYVFARVMAFALHQVW